jgi:hypothetical protein
LMRRRCGEAFGNGHYSPEVNKKEDP